MCLSIVEIPATLQKTVKKHLKTIKKGGSKAVETSTTTVKKRLMSEIKAEKAVIAARYRCIGLLVSRGDPLNPSPQSSSGGCGIYFNFNYNFHIHLLLPSI